MNNTVDLVYEFCLDWIMHSSKQDYLNKLIDEFNDKTNCTFPKFKEIALQNDWFVESMEQIGAHERAAIAGYL